VGEQPAILMGSSLGGYLAALYASRHPSQVEKLVACRSEFVSMARFFGEHRCISI
jgi:pimeloyl-ACP methyl ester carboxylesterase